MPSVPALPSSAGVVLCSSNGDIRIRIHTVPLWARHPSASLEGTRSFSFHTEFTEHGLLLVRALGRNDVICHGLLAFQ